MFLNKILGYGRLFVMAILTLPFFLISFLVGWGKDKLNKARLVKLWCKLMVWLFGFKIKVEGRPPKTGTYLFVCNHRSSLDPLILLSKINAYPVSKADVSKYPMVGPGAVNVGVIFVIKTDRTSRSNTKVAIHDALKEGRSVVIFPEGRTAVQETTITFQKGSYDQAAELGIPVVPIAMDYKYRSDYWDHSDTMVDHYLKNLAKWRTPVKVVFGDPIHSDNSFTLLRSSQSWINEQVLRLRDSWEK